MYYHLRKVTSTDVSNQRKQETTETPIVVNASVEKHDKNLNDCNDDEVTEARKGSGSNNEEDEETVCEKNKPVEERVYFRPSGRTPQSPFVRYVMFIQSIQFTLVSARTLAHIVPRYLFSIARF